ncbi:hypothetical protein JNB11_07805 [Kocuria palustris]|nr:hypothetical protein [Kocuria palustris]
MSQFDPQKYVPTIDVSSHTTEPVPPPASHTNSTQAILLVADLEEITVNKIRNALQELFSIDLRPHKVSALSNCH